MQLFVKTQTQKNTSGTKEEVNQGTQTSFNIPNTTIALGTIIIAVIQAIVTIVGALVGAWPKQQTDRELNHLKQKNFQVQLLQRILENPEAADRANSLKLVIAAGLIDDANGKLDTILKTPSNIPKWEKHPLELLNGTMETNPSGKGTADVAKKDSTPPAQPAPKPTN